MENTRVKQVRGKKKKKQTKKLARNKRQRKENGKQEATAVTWQQAGV